MAKKILINGKIYTEDTRLPWAEAVAINGKNFACVGTNDEVIKFAKFTFGEYETVDLKGKTVLPGLIDGHEHPALIAKTAWVIYGPDTYDKEELFENIKKAAIEYPKKKRPYFVYNMYHAETFGAAGPRKEDIDKIISDRPARINDDSGHGCVYNTMALEMLKDENGVPHSDFPITGQTFFKDEKGEYTGVAFQTIQNGDKGVFKALGWEPPTCMNDDNSAEVLNIMRHYGDIGCMEAATKMEGDVEYLYNLDKQGKLYFYFEPTILLNNCDDIENTISIAKKWRKYETDHIRIRTVKFFGDGSAEAGDVLSLEPFSNDSEGKNCGSCNFTFEQMRDVLVRCNKERLDFHMHTICDGTLRRMLDAIEAAQKICGDDWCIKVTLAHLEFMHPDDAKRFKKLGVYADITAHWLGDYTEATALFMGPERMKHHLDFSQFRIDKVKYGFSADNASPLGKTRIPLFLGFQIAKTAIEPGDNLVKGTDLNKFPNGRLPDSAKFTIEECIHASTWTNAERMRILDKVGSIEVGKRACLVVLDKDIFTIPDNEIKTINPVCTYFDGEECHFPDPLAKK